MLSLVVVLLSATPGHASLLSSPEAPLRPSARLLAQASPEAPPPPLVSAPDARIHELTARVAELNERIRTLNTDWPLSSVAMTYTGYVFAPFLLIGLPLTIVGLVSTAEFASTLATIGLVTTAVGGVGVVLLIAGIVTGINASQGPRAERQQLIRERTRLEDELRALKRRQEAVLPHGASNGPARFVTVASVAF
jgi:hypothetical protein